MIDGNVPDSAPVFEDYLVPVLWEAVRAARDDRLVNPEGWIQPLIGAGSPRELVTAAIRYLEGTSAVDLSWRVLRGHEHDGVQVIDTESDLLRVLLLLLAARPVSGRGLEQRLGQAVRHRQRELNAIGEEELGETGIANRLGYESGVPAALEFVRAAIRSFEAAEAEQIRSRPVDVERVLRIVISAQRQAESQFPRSMLSNAGALGFTSVEQAMTTRDVTLRMPKRFLVDDDVYGLDSIGEHAGSRLSSIETELLMSLLRTRRGRGMPRGGIVERVQRAMAAITRHGMEPTHVLLPMDSWELARELSLTAPTNRLAVELALAYESSQAWVLSLPSAISWIVLGDEASWLRWTIGEDRSPPEADFEPDVVVTIQEEIQVRVTRSSVASVNLEGLKRSG